MHYDWDVIVIGGGAAGLVASKFAAGAGKRVAIIEKYDLGGECTLRGCVPSKTLIRAAKVLHQASIMKRVGIDVEQKAVISLSPVMDHVRSVVARVYAGHGPGVLERQGVKVIMGEPHFRDRHRVEINGTTITAGAFIIATGSSPSVPPLPGIDRVPFHTNSTLFDIAAIPASMIILGGGPIGIEMAQAFHYLGTRVTVVEMEEQILAREDKELRDLLAGRLVSQGISLRTGERATELAYKEGEIKVMLQNQTGAQAAVEAEVLLVAVGRKANVQGLDLEAAGVEYSAKGIKTDRRLRTTANNIYACGDVVGPFQFSHMAEYQARIAARNALLPVKTSADYDHYIWCTFSDPELAHAGLTEEEARKTHGNGIRIYKWRYGDIDRGKTESEDFGMSKIICDKSYRILGAHILGERAGELIHEAQIMKTLGVPFYKLDSIIHVYPAFSDIIRQPAKIARIERLRNNVFIKVIRRLTGR
jgi:pyruvate/2-oxoglutarate dehydrogenase complex dihydrolipoamide dehydrogenase (E3) component